MEMDLQMKARARQSPRTKKSAKSADKARTDAIPPYARTQADLEAFAEFDERLKVQGLTLPHVVVKKADDISIVSLDHPDPATAGTRVMNALGTADHALATGMISQVGDIAKHDAGAMDFHLALVRGIKPTDAVETALAVQMAAIHAATMTAASRLARVNTIEQQDSASTMVNKLARTFAFQVETLKKHRSTGEQTVTVQHQHVTVNDGGKAIVAGQMEAGGGGTQKNGGQSHEPYGPAESSPALLSQLEAIETALPCTGNSRQESLPLSRCEGRGT